MAALVKSGFIAQISDKSVPWNDRIVIVSAAMQHQDMYIPNKYQVCLDWLCNVVINRKRHDVHKDDLKLTWKLLREILKTSDHPVILKASFNQVLHSCLVELIQDLEHTCYTALLECMEVVFTTHSTIFTAKFEHMVQMCSAVITLVCRQILQDTCVPEVTRRLLKLVLDCYDRNQRLQANQKQVLHQTAEFLLHPSLVLIHVAQATNELLETEVTLSDMAVVLENILLSAFFHKDHESSYEVFLSSPVNEEQTTMAKQKALTHIFEKVAMILDNQDDDSFCGHSVEACLTFLPKLLKGYVSLLRPSLESGLSFMMFSWLLKMLGLEDGAVTRIDCKLKTIHELLSIVSSEEVYSPGMDNASGNTQLKYLHKMAALLMKLEHSHNPYWFKTWERLLELNHLIIEGKLVELLQAAWFTSKQLSGEALSSQSHFLCTLISTYSRLRQFPKLLKKIFEAVRSHDNPKNMSFRNSVIKTLGSCCEQLPQNTTVDTWLLFITEIKEECITKEDDSSLTKLVFLVRMLNQFLVNVKVADYSITDSTASKVLSHMEQMRDDMILPLLNRFLRNRDNRTGECCLQLLHTWGDLVMLLHYHTKYSGKECCSDLSSASGFEDLNYVHPYLGTEMSFLLSQKTTATNNTSLEVLFMTLVVQKMRAMQLFVTVQDSSAFKTSIQNCIQFLFKKLDVACCSASWDNEVSSINKESATIAKWKLTLDGLPLFASHLSHDQLTLVARFLVNNVLTPDGVRDCESEESTTTSIAKKFLGSRSFPELGDLHRAIITVVWNQLVDVVGPCQTLSKSDTPKKKKRKSSSRDSELATTISNNINVDELESLLIKSTPGKLMKSSVLQVKNILQVLLEIPLENLNILEATKCLSNLLLLLLTNTCDLDLAAVCSELCCVILDRKEIVPLFTFQDSGELLSLMLAMKGDTVYAKMLFKKLVALAVREETSLVALQSCVDKVFELVKGRGLTKENTVMPYLPCITQTIVRILLKGYLAEAIRNVALGYFTKLMECVISLTGQIVQCEDTAEYMAPIVESFNIIVWYHCVQNVDMTPDMNQLAVQMVQKVSALLQVPETKTASLVSCLRYSQLVFEYKQKFDSTSDTERFVDNFWQHFIHMFKQFNRKLASRNLETVQKSTALEKVLNTPLQQECSLTHDICALLKTDDEVDSPQTCKTLSNDVEVDEADVKTELQKTFVAYVNNCGSDKFTGIVYGILQMLAGGDGNSNVSVACLLWRQLLEMPLSEQQYKVLSLNAQNVLMSFQALMLTVSSSRRDDRIYDIVIPILNTLAVTLTHGSSLLSTQCVVMCLPVLLYVPMAGLSIATFSQVFQAFHSVLNEMMVHHSKATLSVIPSYLHCSKRLTSAAIYEGRQRHGTLDDDNVEELVKCAHLVERIYALMVAHKKEFSKVAIYAIADYVSEVQKVTLIPAVKKALLPAVYKLLAICDEHSIAQIHSILNAGVKEIFKAIYAEYTKYYKYKGRV